MNRKKELERRFKQIPFVDCGGCGLFASTFQRHLENGEFEKAEKALASYEEHIEERHIS